MQNISHLCSLSLHPLQFFKQLDVQHCTFLAIFSLGEEDGFHYCLTDRPGMASRADLKPQLLSPWKRIFPHVMTGPGLFIQNLMCHSCQAFFFLSLVIKCWGVRTFSTNSCLIWGANGQESCTDWFQGSYNFLCTMWEIVKKNIIITFVKDDKVDCIQGL